MKVTLRLPSKRVQYGYAEVEFEMEGLTAESLGDIFVDWTLRFQSAEIDAVDAFEAKMKEAEQLFKEELGATVVSEEKHKDMYDNAPNDGPEPAPWEQPAPPASPKPWENTTFTF